MSLNGNRALAFFQQGPKHIHMRLSNVAVDAAWLQIVAELYAFAEAQRIALGHIRREGGV